MTTPLLDPDETQLYWRNRDQRRSENLATQQAQDSISVPAQQLGTSDYYERLNTIRQDSASATAGAIAADQTKKQYEAAKKAAEFARAQQAAQQNAYNAMNGFSVGQYDGTGGGAPGWGSGGAQGVANVLRQAGFSEDLIPTFMAIARAESGWNPSALNTSNSNGTTDAGLFQINSVHAGNPWYPQNLNDPLQSAKAALEIYKQQGLNAWTVYKTGKYKEFLQAAPPIQPYVANTGASGLRNAQVSQTAIYPGVPQYNGGNYGPPNSRGLAGNASAARDFVRNTFGISNIGGFGGGSVSGSDHPRGKAIDVMIPNYGSSSGINQGNSIAQWFINNPAAFGTKYIIWRDRIWQNGVWKSYGHPTMHNDTGQHRDHVHISFL